ncbi:phage tail protein I [Escherichia coli]|nr:phage tail protein I [Escherichia coli]
MLFIFISIKGPPVPCGGCGAVRILIRIIEWWQTGETPGTFRLDIGVQDQGITEDTYLELERLISDAKPCSRHMIGMSINLQTSGPHWVGAASYLGEEITIYPYINETIISGGTAHEAGGPCY